MSEPNEDLSLKIIAYLIEKAGGQVTISQSDFVDFPDNWWLNTTLDVRSGAIKLSVTRQNETN